MILSFIYNGSHSIHFIEALDSSTNSTPTAYSSKINSWNDLHLIPLTRSSIVTPSPSIKLIEVPGTNSRIDLTDLQPGGLKYGVRSGSWKFAIDHYKYTDWHTAKKTIENALNGKRLYCVLDDDLSSAYRGRFSVESWEPGVNYSSVTIKYQLEAKRYTNAFNIISAGTEAKMIASWVEVDEAIRDGSYRTKYLVGDSIYLTLGSEYNGYAELVGIDLDMDSNNNPIPMTWITRNFCKTKYGLNEVDPETVNGGWPSYTLRNVFNTTIKKLFPERVKSMLISTSKVSRDTVNNRDLITNDYLWLPSYREVFGSSSYYEQSGPIYSSMFYNSNTRRRSTTNWSSDTWNLRTPHKTNRECCLTVNNYGNLDYSSIAFRKYYLIGFCTGAST